jgi:hypothetical protein
MHDTLRLMDDIHTASEVSIVTASVALLIDIYRIVELPYCTGGMYSCCYDRTKTLVLK